MFSSGFLGFFTQQLQVDKLEKVGHMYDENFVKRGDLDLGHQPWNLGS